MTPDTEAARFADMTAELHRDIYAFLDSPQLQIPHQKRRRGNRRRKEGTMTSTALAIRPSESGAARAMTYTERVTQAIDLYRAGDLDAAELDSMLTLIAGWLRWDSAIVGPNASRQRVETMCALMKIGTRLDSLQRNHSIDTREIPRPPASRSRSPRRKFPRGANGSLRRIARAILSR